MPAGCSRIRKNVLEREAQGTTGVGGGVAIPHGKSNAVLVPALAAVTLREAIDYQHWMVPRYGCCF